MASEERATFSFGFFDGGPTTEAPAAAVVPPTAAKSPPTSADAAAAAEARLLTAFADAASSSSPPPSPIEVAPGVTLLKLTVAGEAAAAALLQSGGGGATATAASGGGEGGPPTATGRPDEEGRRRQLLAESDLVKGTYEGGFKLWEGALDLCAYLVEEQEGGCSLLARLAAQAAEADDDGPCYRPHPRRRRPRVLELGCGHGLPGLLCLLAGADVDFQDYNAEVLEQLTRPNVEANLASTEVLAGVRRAAAKAGVSAGGGEAAATAEATAPPPPPASPGRARYIAGDWRGLPALLRRLEEEEGGEEDDGEEEGRRRQGEEEEGAHAHAHGPRQTSYDLVLTAETLYDAESGQAALLSAVEAAVGSSPSAALVASKTHYFGVQSAGGTSAFRALLALRRRQRGRDDDEQQQQPPSLAVVEARCTVLQDGASNRREVLWLDRSA
jgi:predicted nicotinamide N-methyase